MAGSLTAASVADEESEGVLLPAEGQPVRGAGRGCASAGRLLCGLARLGVAAGSTCLLLWTAKASGWWQSEALPAERPSGVELAALPGWPPAHPGRCSRVGEECRATMCCRDEGMQCLMKNEFYAGCRSNCTAGSPEPGASGPYATEPWTCTKPDASCACQRRCMGMAGCPGFPEMDYIYLPERSKDVERARRAAEEFDLYACGHEGMRKVLGVDPSLWSQGGGRYDKVEWFGHQVPPINATGVVPWWEAHNLDYAAVDSNGESKWLQRGLQHHAGCGLSHFVTWMDARARKVPHVIILESDGLPSFWWQVYVGNAADFDSVVLALLEEVPRDWDVIFLDKGRSGVVSDEDFVKGLRRECWSGKYEIYKWSGNGVAGLAMYMVSHRFLDKVPHLIQEHGLDMVDAWMGIRCNPKDGGKLKCFTVATSDRAAVVP